MWLFQRKGKTDLSGPERASRCGSSGFVRAIAEALLTLFLPDEVSCRCCMLCLVAGMSELDRLKGSLLVSSQPSECSFHFNNTSLALPSF